MKRLPAVFGRIMTHLCLHFSFLFIFFFHIDPVCEIQRRETPLLRALFDVLSLFGKFHRKKSATFIWRAYRVFKWGISCALSVFLEFFCVKCVARSLEKNAMRGRCKARCATRGHWDDGAFIQMRRVIQSGRNAGQFEGALLPVALLNNQLLDCELKDKFIINKKKRK